MARARRFGTQLFLGSVFGVLGGVFLYFSADTLLHCTRVGPRRVDCVLTRQVFSSFVLREQPLLDVRGAHVDEAVHSQTGRPPYRVTCVMVETAEGGTALSNHRRSGDDEAARRITEFVRDPAQAEIFERQAYGDGWVGQWAGSALLGLGALTVVGAAVEAARPPRGRRRRMSGAEA